jgi:methionyl-tRNA formyltransferase
MYENIIVIGFGKIALENIKTISKFFKKKKFFIYYEKDHFSLISRFAKKNKFKIIETTNKKKIEHFLSSFKKKTLIVSSNNNYLFPKKIIDMKNIKIINFHNGYLPLYKGRNTQVWSIFNMEKFGGLTWHFVSNRGIDAGPIIFRKKIKIFDNTTAIDLTKKCMEQGAKAFDVLFTKIINNKIKIKKFKNEKAKKLYYSNQLPNNCKLELKWKITKISAFLRSMDFKPLIYFKNQFFVFNKKKYKIMKYKILDTKINKAKKTFLKKQLIFQSNYKKIIINYGK